MADLFHAFKVWKKFVEVRTITDEGAYAKDEVPESYAGAELDVEVIQRVIFTDSSGQILELRFDDIEDLKDSEGKTGMAIEILDTDGSVLETIDATGDSEITVQWVARTALDPESSVYQKAAASNSLLAEQRLEAEESGD